MKQVFLERGSIKLNDVPLPLVHDKELLVRVAYSFISSGTERTTVNAAAQSLGKKFFSHVSENSSKIFGALKEHGLAGTTALIKSKMNQVMPLGYSCSGQVIKVGNNVTRFRIGDFVACAGSGIAHHAQVITAPENLTVTLKNEAQLKHASITTIGAIALQGVRRANVQLGEKVCVIGLGLLGQLTTQLLKKSGSTIYGTDIDHNRLHLAKISGIDRSFHATEENIINEINATTHHRGVDTTIITAGSADGGLLEQAMHITRRKGKVILVGDVKLDFSRDHFYAKEIDLLISCSYGPGRYDKTYEQEGIDYPYSYVRWTENRNMQLFADMIEQKTVTIDHLVSQEISIDDAEIAFKKLQEQQALGIILSYPHIETPDSIENKNRQKNISNKALTYTPPQGKLQVGIVGVGGFCKIKLLPTIAALGNLAINAIVDLDQAQALTVGKTYNTQMVDNNIESLLHDTIHAVVIATPHHLHTAQALQSLQAGKAVFVEKPAAVNFEQLETLKTFFNDNPNAFYCADFNRSWAPCMTKIKEVITQRTNPLIINYRMNAGYLPTDHWIQSESNRGRIIGEACHIFELFLFLTDAQPTFLAVQSIMPAESNYLPTDNVQIMLTMSDGSCCSFTYTAQGSTALDKEYMELFFDGKSITMRDYKELIGYGLPKAFSHTSRNAQKGHEELIKAFFAAAQQKDGRLPIPLKRILNATEISLLVDRLARSGGGIYDFRLGSK